LNPSRSCSATASLITELETREKPVIAEEMEPSSSSSSSSSFTVLMQRMPTESESVIGGSAGRPRIGSRSTCRCGSFASAHSPAFTSRCAISRVFVLVVPKAAGRTPTTARR